MKAFMRGTYIREISKRKSKNRALTVAHQKRVWETERAFVESPSDSRRVSLEEAHKLLADHLLQQSDNKRFFLQQKYFDQGESAGHLLATVVRSQQSSSHIAKLVTDSGEEVTDGTDILRVLCEFYEELYASKLVGSMEELAVYLEGVPLPVLSDPSRAVLDLPISCAELEEALQAVPNEKAPGSDGLPAEFYKLHKELLLPRLLEVIQEAMDTGHLPRSMREAVIVLVPKSGKDPTSPGSYRPISLLPVDVKVVAKVLANRLSKCIGEIIHDDQAGFMPNRSTATNLRRLYLNLQLSSSGLGSRAILSLDAAKAFDSVEWEFLWAVLRRMGFGPYFISMVQLLYSAPVARVRAGGLLSAPFSLGRGTRQGCPLSPLLFAIAVEPLACILRQDGRTRGFFCGQVEEKVSLYADDILLFLGDVGSSIGRVMSLIGEFGVWSGLRINWDKSVLLPVDPLPPNLPPEAAQVQVVSEFRYLGVMVSARPADYVSLNIFPLLSRLSSKVDAWCRLPLTVIGRGNLIKMILMPQILYFLHNSPVWIPMHIFHRFHRLFRELLWQKKYARIRLETLQRDKDAGGLAIPNTWLYFLASQLQHLAGWARDGEIGAAGRLIQEWSGDSRLSGWLEKGGPGIRGVQFPTLALIYKVWDRGKGALGCAGCSKFSPIWDNRLLPELCKLTEFESWKALGIFTIGQIQVAGVLKSFAELQSDYKLPPRALFQYLRLKHAYQTQIQSMDLRVWSNPCLERILSSQFTKGLISWAYRCLLTAKVQVNPLLVRQGWEREVGPISEEHWDELLELTPQLSLSEPARFSQLLLLHRAYRSPAVLFKMGVRGDSCCPRCGMGEAHIMHMLWECSEIGQFWREVLAIIQRVFEVSIPPQPQSCVLGIIRDLVCPEPKFLGVSRMLFQARKLLAMHWIQPAPPTVGEFIGRMNHTLRLEKGVYIKRKAFGKFENIWGPWLDTPGLPSDILLRDRVVLW